MTKIPLSLLSAAIMTDATSAQQRTFYDSRGTCCRPISRLIAAAGSRTTTRGKVITRVSTSGNQTTVYDADGRNVGRVRTSR